MPSIAPESSPLAFIARPEEHVPIAERDIRLDDYLNDKIQTATDFANLASLIANVEIQKKQLEEQQKDARKELAAAKQASEDHTTSMLQRIRDFEKHQDSIHEQMMVVTTSDTPVEAVQRVRGPMGKLRRVELAEAYMELLKDIDTLAQEAREHLPADPKSSLRPYTRLKQLSLALRERQPAAEGAATHIVAYAENTTTQLWIQMKKIMSDEFRDITIKDLNWPGTKADPVREQTREWSDCFTKLLDLQAPEIAAAREPLVLLPIGVMAQPFVTQFRFHFMTDKPTNHPHQLGDNFFKWIVGTVVSHEVSLRENVGPNLAAHFRGSPLAGNTLYIDPVSAFITALLPVVKQKVEDLMEKLSDEPRLMSQFVVQLIGFDETLRTTFDYTAGNTEIGWKGLAWDLLDIWFDDWWKHEKTFALERYQEVISDQGNGRIDYDSTGPGKTKSTYGATKVVDLLKTVTEQYRDLRKFSFKVRFLLGIQLAILDQYHERLSDSLSVYQSYTSALGRTLHGVTKEQEAALQGIGALESLCKVYGSADNIVVALQEWSNDEFFIELWETLQARAKVTDDQGSIAGPMTLNEVKDATSTALGTEGEGGAMFDECIISYKTLRNKTERFIVQAIKYAYPVSFRPYFTKPQWTTITDEPVAVADLNVTAELDQPLQTLQQDLNFLTRTLSATAFRRIWRECLDSLQDLLWNEVLMRQDFTTLGAAQFMRDLLAILDMVDKCCRNVTGTTALGMPRLREAVELLNLPVVAPNGTMSIKEASDRSYGAHDQALEVIQEVGLAYLQVVDVRQVLARRVEVSSE